MRRIPLARRGQLKAYIEPLAPLGYSPEMILARSGIASWLHGPAGDWVPVQYLSATMDAAARAVGDHRYGFWVAEQGSIQDLQPIGRSLAGAVSLYEGLDRCAKTIKKLNNSLHFWLAEDDSNLWFCKNEPGALEDGREHVEQYAVSKMVQLVRLGLGRNWTPQAVHLITGSPQHFANWEAFGDATFECGQPYSAIAIPKSLLNAPFPGRTQCANGKHGSGQNSALPNQSLAESLRLLVSAHLLEGAPNIEQAAEIAGVSSRTLKRWLAKEGLTYREIVNQARYIRAKQLLKDADIPIAEIAYQLGYANAPHFWRAFRHWAGVSPGEFRKFSLERPADWPLAAPHTFELV